MLLDLRPPRGGGRAEPWRDEPDRAAWRDSSTWLQCLILRHSSFGFLCGYVRVPRDHPLHGKHHDLRRIRRNVDVHGGLTFSGCIGGRRMKRGHWFGFDCGHAFDLVPGMIEVLESSRLIFPAEFLDAMGQQQVYRNIEYVYRECTALAQQLARLGER